MKNGSSEEWGKEVKATVYKAFVCVPKNMSEMMIIMNRFRYYFAIFSA